MERLSFILLMGGLGMFVFAFLSLAFAPWLMLKDLEPAHSPFPTEVPREFRDVYASPAEHERGLLEGRDVYVAEGCWHCHSQFVRPVANENLRYGPVSTAEEYNHRLQLPQLFGTRRVGPDLIRVGMKYSADWHLAHHYEPKYVVPDTVMPAYPWLFEKRAVRAVKGAEAWTVEPGALPDGPHEVQLTLNDRLEAYTPKRAGRLVLLLTRRTEELLAAAGGAFTLITPGPRGFAMAAYLQSLGAHTWKERLRMLDSSGGDHAIAASSSEAPAALLQRGREVYERNCTGCHGARGEGDGLAAIFFEFKPRNFTTTNFKLRSTPPGEFPTDQDLFRAITRGMPGTAMPPWRELPELDRWGLVHYVKLLARQGLREYFRSLPPEERVGEEELEQIVRDRTTPTRTIPVSVPVAADAAAVERGKGLFEKLGCGQCHGKDLKGRSREEGFDWTDEAGRFLPRSADLTAGVFKGGAAAKDLYLRLMSGMNVGPMPSFEAGLPSEEDRWSLVHFLVSLSREK